MACSLSPGTTLPLPYSVLVNTDLVLRLLFKVIACSVTLRDTEDLSQGVGNFVVRNFVAMRPGRTIIRLYCLHVAQSQSSRRLRTGCNKILDGQEFTCFSCQF
jgi:hypothetical protein